VVLSPGMCGGPVVGKRGSICGMIDGIVPIDHSVPELQGCPVITEAPDILRYTSKYINSFYIRHCLFFSILCINVRLFVWC
jgi:Ni,Fe-hydrogenase III small subunit